MPLIEHSNVGAFGLQVIAEAADGGESSCRTLDYMTTVETRLGEGAAAFG